MWELHLVGGAILLVEDGEGIDSFRRWLKGTSVGLELGAEFKGYDTSATLGEADFGAPPAPIYLAFDKILFVTTAA